MNIEVNELLFGVNKVVVKRYRLLERFIPEMPAAHYLFVNALCK